MTIWPFLLNVRPLMAAFLPAFTFYPISTSPKTWSDTFGNSKHRFQSISRGASITSSASLGSHLVLHTVNSTRIQAPWLPPKHAKLITACFCPGLYTSYPLARSTVCYPHPMWWFHICGFTTQSHLLSSQPLPCPGRTQKGLDAELGKGRPCVCVY